MKKSIHIYSTPEQGESADQIRLQELLRQREIIDNEIRILQSRIGTGSLVLSDKAKSAQAQELESLDRYRDNVPPEALSLLAAIIAYHENDIEYNLEPSSEIQAALSAQMSKVAPGYELFWNNNKPVVNKWYNYISPGHYVGQLKLVKVLAPGLMFEGHPMVPARIQVK